MTLGFNEKLRGLLTKDAMVNIFLLTCSLGWYSYAIVFLQESIVALSLDFNSNMLVWGTHLGGLILSAILGASLTKTKGNRKRFLAIWLAIGTLSSFAPLVFNTGEALGTIAAGLILGVSFGFGMPNCIGYFVQQTPIQNRGRIGGLVFVLTGSLIVVLDSLRISDVVALAGVLAALRGISLFAIPFVKESAAALPSSEPPAYRKMFGQRPFLLYFVPWLLFSLLNYLTTPFQQSSVKPPEVFSDMMMLQNVFIGIFALAGGVFMDKVGRKRVAIVGFVLQGLSFSIVGFSQNTTVWYLHSILNGVSWGILCVLFVMIIWGDLSQEVASDKFYALGVSPFFISKMMQVTVDTKIYEMIGNSAIFSFSALFLFLAVLPLIYVPETLPEKIMKERELRSYLEKAQKIAVKSQEKELISNNNDKEICPEKVDDGVEFEVKQEDLEEAEQLAQKYY